MNERNATIEFIMTQCKRWPAIRPQDLLKALHQSVFGCGHLVTDETGCLAQIEQELTTCFSGNGPELEPLDGEFCRLYMRYLKRSGLSPKTLCRLFVLSAEKSDGSVETLEKKLSILLELAETENLPFSSIEASEAIVQWRAMGYPPCRHSREFRAAYAPAYRVVSQEYMWVLPLLEAIDCRLDRQPKVLVALEGGSAAGKSTLAALLSKFFDCNVFHMDDFFLQPQQRTKDRLAELGGNVDWERFLDEVLQPLAQGEAVQYRPYDCHTQAVGGPVRMESKALNIVEGTYSMHPALADYFDLSVFLRISPEQQRYRIERRNQPEVQRRFFDTWIPLERRYFEGMDTAEHCDLILEVEP